MGVVSDIRTLAISNGYEFIYGSNEYRNYEADNKNLIAKDLIWLAPIITTKSYTNGIENNLSINVQTVIGLAKLSKPDETFEQKYDTRLATMTTNLQTFIKKIGCLTNFEMTRLRMFEEINKYDANVDIVVAEINFNYGT